MSDHLPLVYYSDQACDTCSSGPHTINRRNFSPGNIKEIKAALQKSNWDILQNMDVNTAYQGLINNITKVIDIFAPLQTVTLSKKKYIRDPWITKDVRKSSLTLDKLYKKKVRQAPEHPSHTKYTHVGVTGTYSIALNDQLNRSTFLICWKSIRTVLNTRGEY